MVEFVQLTTECCWGQPSDPCQRGCLTSHACVMWGPRTLNADDDDDDDMLLQQYQIPVNYYHKYYYIKYQYHMYHSNNEKNHNKLIFGI